jgi:hypothetical protein
MLFPLVLDGAGKTLSAVGKMIRRRSSYATISLGPVSRPNEDLVTLLHQRENEREKEKMRME